MVCSNKPKIAVISWTSSSPYPDEDSFSFSIISQSYDNGPKIYSTFSWTTFKDFSCFDVSAFILCQIFFNLVVNDLGFLNIGRDQIVL